METLKHILTKYKITNDKEDKIFLPIGRHKELPKLFTELGFTKGAEIGVYKGEYSKELLEQIPNLSLIGIDMWKKYRGYRDFGRQDLKDAYVLSKEIYDKYPSAIMFRCSSLDAAKCIPDESLDFVFIDGNHAYEYVVEDIAAWSKKVRPGGIVAGHDYDDYSGKSRRYLMNVINAVDGWCKSYEIKPLFITTHNKNKVWFYVKDVK